MSEDQWDYKTLHSATFTPWPWIAAFTICDPHMTHTWPTHDPHMTHCAGDIQLLGALDIDPSYAPWMASHDFLLSATISGWGFGLNFKKKHISINEKKHQTIMQKARISAFVSFPLMMKWDYITLVQLCMSTSKDFFASLEARDIVMPRQWIHGSRWNSWGTQGVGYLKESCQLGVIKAMMRSFYMRVSINGVT